MKESEFQHGLKKELQARFPGCVVLKNDANYLQGIPDLLVLYKDRWAALECKRERNAKRQPNQKYYVEKLNEMSYAAVVFPENREEVLNDLEQAFRA